ncbi:MAG: hypothetical protein GY711_01090 [bacterium]|nr:hypothetical protein [bacterium]
MSPRTLSAATSVGTKAIIAGGYYTDVVDIYDDTTGTWSVAALSVPRSQLTATTVGFSDL